MSQFKHIDFKVLAEEFEAEWQNKIIKDYEHSMSDKAFKTLYHTNWLFKKLGLLTRKDLTFDQGHESKTAHLCLGGTCTHGHCHHIGRVVNCDTGCTYLG